MVRPAATHVPARATYRPPVWARTLASDIREVYSEAKGQGFDTKIMRQVVRMRKLETADRQEMEAILDLYLAALGMRK